MIVFPVAHTILDIDSVNELTGWEAVEKDVTDLDALGEVAGRSCYLSWNRPNPNTYHNTDYMNHILDSAHESVLEHSTVTFWVAEVSRSFLGEITRHRHISPSVLSQRYVKAEKMTWVVPPDIRGSDSEAYLSGRMQEVFDLAQEVAAEISHVLKREGLPHKRANSAARSVLPNATATSMFLTGNLRAWRDVLKKRHHVAADEELQEFAEHVLSYLRKLAPHSMQDIPNEPYGV